MNNFEEENSKDIIDDILNENPMFFTIINK